MNKRLLLTSTLSFTLLTITPVWAGGVDNKSSFSAEYIRTWSRNAATDSADIVVYNPAGIMQMADGTYLNLTGQFLTKDYSNQINNSGASASDGDLAQDVPSVIPSLFGLHKKNNWAAMAAFTITGGGGKVRYDNGNATTVTAGQSILLSPITNQRVEAESYYTRLTLGGAYSVNERLAVALTGHHTNAAADFRANLTVAGAGVSPVSEYEKTADGWGATLGLNYAASDKLNLACRYETATHLDFNYEVKPATNAVGQALLAGQGITNGLQKRRDLPALLGLGASYRWTPDLKVDASITYYLQENADWGGAENNVDNAYDLGISLEYTIKPNLKASLGYMYTETGIEARYMVAEAPELDANSIGAGLAYEYTPNLEFNFAIGKSFYKDASFIHPTASLDVTYSKTTNIAALGIQYKL